MDQVTAGRPRFSLTAEVSPKDPVTARDHFESRLAFEVDPADVEADMRKGTDSFTLVDARRKDAYETEHVYGAISLPVRSITEKTAANLPPDRIYTPTAMDRAAMPPRRRPPVLVRWGST